MTTSAVEHRFYGDLAPWWPLISPPEEYAEEAEFAASLLTPDSDKVDAPNRPSVLELGSGGGHLASHLAGRFDLTLVDISEPMLEVSRRLNPGATHRQGDMRAVRLNAVFDAVLIHDAIDYMISEDDLAEAIATAYEHCRPGGHVVIVPDDVAESFEPRTEHGGSDADDGRAARYLEWSWDPDPNDSWTVTHYTFVLRSADGTVEVVHEAHRFGLFPRDTWIRLMTEAGLEARAHSEIAKEDEQPRLWFLGHRPS
jgi:SAM-dependent methyltransferase